MHVESTRIREIYRATLAWEDLANPDRTVAEALDALDSTPTAFGYRIVHGGTQFQDPVLIDAGVESALESLIPLAPLHNSAALAAIRATRRKFPDAPAVAVFDTAFHSGRPAESMHYALPRSLVDKFKIRRYGFHGIAHESLVEQLAGANGCSRAEVSGVTLQLGAGCSGCAVRNGGSIETSMGFSPLEGLVMATRCGDIDPAIVLQLVRAGYGAENIEAQLNKRSGLLGLCGSGDMREILRASDHRNSEAALALKIFVRRIVLLVGAYFTLLEGEGVLAFGGGIGTGSSVIRQHIAQGLKVWNVELDAALNRANEQGKISTPGSRPVYVLETNEERVIARRVAEVLSVQK